MYYKSCLPINESGIQYLFFDTEVNEGSSYFENNGSIAV